MGKPNHSTKKKPGRAKWFKRRNKKANQAASQLRNQFKFLENYKKGQVNRD